MSVKLPEGRYLPQLSNGVSDLSIAPTYTTEYQPHQHQYYPTITTSAQRPNKEYNYDLLVEQLFEWQWLVMMPRKWTYSQYDYEVVGVTVLEDSDEDMQSMNSWNQTTRSIADLVELYDEGKEFSLVMEEDVKRIFDIIKEYTEYVSFVFNSHIYLANKLEQNDKAKEVLADVVKMQNFANHIFPIMVTLEYDQEVKLSGIIGWIQGYANAGDDTFKLNFDPYAKYGISREEVFNKDNVDQVTGNYKAIDLSKSFDPYTFDKIRRYT